MQKKKDKIKSSQQIFNEIIARFTLRLHYCLVSNGLPYCKNCGLEQDDVKFLEKQLEDYKRAIEKEVK